MTALDELVQSLLETVTLVSEEWQKVADHPRATEDQRMAALEWAMTVQDGRQFIENLRTTSPTVRTGIDAAMILQALVSSGDRARHLQRCMNAGHTVVILNPRAH